MKLLIVILFFVLNNLNGGAQKVFSVSIQVPNSIKTKAFLCSYDNGIGRIEVSTDFKNKILTFGGKFYSKFATLYLNYNINDSISISKNYFINELPARFSPKDPDGLTDSVMLDFNVENALDVSQKFSNKERSEFSKGTIDGMNRFMDENGAKVWQNDSLKQMFYKNLDAVNKSDIEFVKENKDEYFAFWFFRTQIVANTFIPSDVNVAEIENLLNIYNTTFSPLYGHTIEGDFVRSFLTEKIDFKKTGWLNIKKNHIAPNFKAKDIDGNVITLSSLRGKYVLIDFWATWCGPCMAAVPFIRKIRAEYPISKLKIIGISSDYNYQKFVKGVKMNRMNWTHIFNNEQINSLYGIEKIPATYLINTKGVIIYSSLEDDNELLVRLLRKIKK